MNIQQDRYRAIESMMPFHDAHSLPIQDESEILGYLFL